MSGLSFPSTLAVGLTGAAHVGFAALECFLWRSYGAKKMKLGDAFTLVTADLAKNQGVYNLFLAAGLFWSIFRSSKNESVETATFFSMCVCIAALVSPY